MQTIKTVENQSIISIALQGYGNVDAICQLIVDNDMTGKMLQPATFDDEIDLTRNFKVGEDVLIDEQSEFYDKQALEELKEYDDDGNGEVRVMVDGITDIKIFGGEFTDEFE